MYARFQELKNLCYESVELKFAKNDINVKNRLELELALIEDAKISDTLLWLYECFHRFCINLHFWHAKGTVNNSLVLYLLGVTSIDPIKHKLPYQFAYGDKDCKNLIFDSLCFETSERQLSLFLGKTERDDYRKLKNKHYPMILSRYVISNYGKEALEGIHYEEEINEAKLEERNKECETVSFIIETTQQLTYLEKVAIISQEEPPENFYKNSEIIDTLMYSSDLDEAFGYELHNNLFYKYSYKYPLIFLEDWILHFNLRQSRGYKYLGRRLRKESLFETIYCRYPIAIVDDLTPVFSSRDSLFEYLQVKGIEENISINLSEAISQGNLASKEFSEKYQEYRQQLNSYDIPDIFWTIAMKIDYLVPKADGINLADTIFKIVWYYLKHLRAFSFFFGQRWCQVR